MAGVKVTITGLDALKKRLDRAKNIMPKEIDAEMKVGADEIRAKAIQAAPADQGLLRAEIQTTHSGFLNYGVFSNALYSGYLEFGTKSQVVIPAGLQDVAAELRSKAGSSMDAKVAIYEWCKREGIEKRLWYPIFIKIMVQGIKPRPFFFQALEQVRPKLLRNIENVLKPV